MAPGKRYFEFPREIIEVARIIQCLLGSNGPGTYVQPLVETGFCHGAGSYGANHIATAVEGGVTFFGQLAKQVRQGSDFKPVELNRLPGGQVKASLAMAFSDTGNIAGLGGG